MAHEVRYCTTPDGASIAYAIAGEGPLCIGVPIPGFSHVQRIVECFPESMSSWFAHFQLVWYDGRGTGMSSRDATDFSLEARIADLRTVIDALNERPVALQTSYDGVPTAIAYATKYPEDVSAMVLVDGWTRFSDFDSRPARAAERALRGQDWVFYTETLARVLLGYEDRTFAEVLASYIRECTTPETLYSITGINEHIDVSDLLPSVRVRTLVLCNQRAKFLPPEVSQYIASHIPGASLRLVDDMGNVLVAPTFAEFLGLQSDDAGTRTRSAFRTVLFTDLVGHTEMMSRLGDAKGRDVLREHERITRDVLKANGGTEVKTMGDGFMASFGSVTKAVECAIALQRAFAEREGEPLSVRVGLNAGEPIEEDGDLFGATVILASRIAAKAAGGEILVSDNVRSLSAGKGFLFSDRGEFVAKGIEEPARVFEVGWR